MDRFSHFLVEEGTDKGQSFTVPDKGGRLGRSSKVDITLDDENLSRQHCEFFFKEEKLWIRDLDSANSTFVNQQPIKEAQLKKGDRVKVGDTQLLILMTASKPRLRMRKDLAPEAAKKPRLNLDRPSPFVRFIAMPLWLLLFIWLVFLGYSVLRDASNDPPRDTAAADSELEPLFPDRQEDTPPAQDTTAATDDTTPAAVAPRPTPPPAVQPPTVAATRPAPTPAPPPSRTTTPRPATPASTSRTSGSAAVDALARSMVFKAMKGEYVPAQEELLGAMSADSSPHNRLLINEMSSYIKALSNLNTTLADLLGAKMGENITLTRGSGRVQIEIQAMTGDIIKGIESSATGDRAISFRTGSIPPKDQCHLLGRPTTKSESFVHCILHMKAGDYNGADLYVSNTGVMQNTLNDILAQLRQ